MWKMIHLTAQITILWDIIAANLLTIISEMKVENIITWGTVLFTFFGSKLFFYSFTLNLFTLIWLKTIESNLIPCLVWMCKNSLETLMKKQKSDVWIKTSFRSCNRIQVGTFRCNLFVLWLSSCQNPDERSWSICWSSGSPSVLLCTQQYERFGLSLPRVSLVRQQTGC